ncbi:MAG: hypothetical protein GC165_07020 [Armatimonadetes bacterium]|nr:hypothetical protein [Armatimonadota bacterium]
MQRRVFDYRSGGKFVVAAFILMWAIGFGYGAVVTPLTSYTINNQPATIDQARTLQVITLGIAITVGALVLWTVLWVLNTKIVIDGEDIRYYNWLGRVTLHSTSNRIMLIPDDSRPSGTKYMTEAGEIKIRTQINNYGALLSILNNARYGFQHWDQRQRKHATYHPSPMTFTYRWTFMHFFSFLWLGVLLFFASLEAGVWGPRPGGMSPAALYTVLLVFSIPGIWLQMTGWVERIVIGPDGIKWIDWTGKTRMSSPFDDIEGSDTSSTYSGNGVRSESLQVYTDHGTIQASSYLQSYSLLKHEIDRVVQSRA